MHAAAVERLNVWRGGGGAAVGGDGPRRMSHLRSLEDGVGKKASWELKKSSPGYFELALRYRSPRRCSAIDVATD